MPHDNYKRETSCWPSISLYSMVKRFLFYRQNKVKQKKVCVACLEPQRELREYKCLSLRLIFFSLWFETSIMIF